MYVGEAILSTCCNVWVFMVMDAKGHHSSVSCPQDIDIKKVNGAPQYAFLQYCDIASVCKAIKKMDGEYLGSNRLKVNILMSITTI